MKSVDRCPVCDGYLWEEFDEERSPFSSVFVLECPHCHSSLIVEEKQIIRKNQVETEFIVELDCQPLLEKLSRKIDVLTERIDVLTERIEKLEK